ncbi:MAG: hypothetical protein K2Y04_12240 [Caulobacteraceae bacterium]|nr:hypothetical protein [Caulobacteraceae bacterium]
MPQQRTFRHYDRLSEVAIGALTYAMKFGLPATNANGTWNTAFLDKAFEGFPFPALFKQLVLDRYSFGAVSTSINGVFVLRALDVQTGSQVFSSSGTEVFNGPGPMFYTLTADAQLAMGVTWLPGSPYYGIHTGVRAWISGQISQFAPGTTIRGTGQSLGGYIIRDAFQTLNLNTSLVTLYQSPGQGGVLSQMLSLGTFGVYNDGGLNYGMGTDFVLAAGALTPLYVLGDPSDSLNPIDQHGYARIARALIGSALESAGLIGLTTSETSYAWTQQTIAMNQYGLGFATINGQTYLVSTDGGNINGYATISLQDARAGRVTGAMAELARAQAADLATPRLPQSDLGMRIGASLGSSIGVMLGGDNILAQVALGTFVGGIGAAFGQWLDYDFADIQGLIGDGIAQSFGQQLGTAFAATGVQVVSSQITNVLMNALGVQGFGAQLGSVVIGSAINHTVATLASRVGIGTAPTGGTFSGTPAAIGSFLGSRLANMVVAPTTQAGGILGSLGGIVGSMIYTQVFQFLGSFAGPIGTFVGTMIGTLIGNLFGRKKPKVPTANAETFLDYASDRFQLGSSSALNGGNLNLVQTMAGSARDTLNAFITILAGDLAYEATSWTYGPAGAKTYYGHTGGQLWVKYGSSSAAAQNVSSADEAVGKGVMWSLDQTRIVGGDIFVKRALLRSNEQDLTRLLAEIQVASDYRRYREDWRGYNRLIAENPYSALAAGWIQTFQRVNEMDLGSFAVSDFYGGLQGFMMSMNPSAYGVALEDVQVSSASGLTLSVGAGVGEGLFSLLPQASADGRSIAVGDLAAIGYVTGTGITAGNDFIDLSGATQGVVIEDSRYEQGLEYSYWQWVGPGPEPLSQYDDHWGDPNWEWVTVSNSYTVTGGDDIFIGGAGGDILSGYTGADWLAGNGGADILNGGEGNDVLIGGVGADQLYGEAGDDYLAGGADNDVLVAGTGDDTLVAGRGADSAYGQDGNDVLVVEGDARWGAAIDAASFDGGNGSDTVSFERYVTPLVKTLNPSVWALAGSNTPAGGFTGVAISMLDLAYGPTDTALTGARFTLVGVENLTGSRFNDYLKGDGQANVLKGGAGSDVLEGGSGDDVLEGGDGADYFAGGVGADMLSYEASRGAVVISLSSGRAFGGEATGDHWMSMENVRGSRHDDELQGDGGSNRLEGGGGDDWLLASAGADYHDGGAGRDIIDYSAYTSGVTVNLGGSTVTGPTAGYGSGANSSHTYLNVEGVLGTNFADNLSAGAGEQEFMAGKGADILSGGAGGDTYYLELGDGWDTVYETNDGSNVLSFGEGIGFNQLTFAMVAGPYGYFNIYYSGADGVSVYGNFPPVSQGKLASAADNNIKVLDMNGAGQLDVSQFERYTGGSAGGDVLSGLRTLGDLIAGFGGNDTIYGMQPGQWDEHGNIIIAGAGDDAIITSVGDDQFAFERGSGRDTISDSGGEDTLVFGPNVTADDIIYKVVGNDLYVGIAEAANPTLGADQVTDYVRVVGGGVKWHDVYSGLDSFSTIEFINAGGTWVDLRKLEIGWTVQYTYGGGAPPIVFDLEGDGLELTGVDDSKVVSRLSSGQLARTSWVGPTDGMLAFDRDGDGQINRLSEISFLKDKEGAKTDLEGLQAWDTNGDGKLNASDDGWSKLLIWVDRNQNGRSTSKELRSLNEAGIVEINLAGKATGNSAATMRDSFVHNTLSFTWASGEIGTAYDVQLARKLLKELGLTAEEVRAAWGDGSADGELGRMAANPAVAAAARLIGASDQRASVYGSTSSSNAIVSSELINESGAAVRGALNDNRGLWRDAIISGDPFSGEPDPGLAIARWADGAEPTDAPEADFSDHDDLYADDEARWADVLSDLGSLNPEGLSSATDELVRATLGELIGESRRGRFSRGIERPDVDPGVDGSAASGAHSGTANDYPPAGQGYPGQGLSQGLSGQTGLVPSRSTQADDRLFQAAALIADDTQTTDLWAPAEFSLANQPSRLGWWRIDGSHQSDVISEFGPEDIEASGIGSGSRFNPAAEQSQHQKLTQALAAFGSDKGSSAAVWKRSGELDHHDLGLAAHGGKAGWRWAAPTRISA